MGNRCVCVCVCVCEDGQASVMLSRTGKLHFSACKGMVGENTWAFYVVRPEGAYVQQGSAADMCTIIVWQVCVAGVCGRCMCSSERGSERSRYVCGRLAHQDCVAGVCMMCKAPGGENRMRSLVHIGSTTFIRSVCGLIATCP